MDPLALLLAECGPTRRSERRIADRSAAGRSKWKLLPGKKRGLLAGTFTVFTQTASSVKTETKGAVL